MGSIRSQEEVASLYACAAALVTGIDQRILDFLNAQPTQEELISPYAVPVNITMKDSGGTLRIRQMLVDRYSVMLLLDFTAPDGVDLNDAEGFGQWTGAGWYVKLCDYLDSSGAEIKLGPATEDWVCLEKDTEKGQITFLYSEYLAEGCTNEAHSIRFSASDLRSGSGQSLLSGEWSCVIPVPDDSGWTIPMNEVYWTKAPEERITEVYLSPMTFHITLERDVPLDGELDWTIWDSPDPYDFFDKWLRKNIILTDKNGETVAYNDKQCIGNPQTTTFTFGFEELVDPARFQGGTLTLRIGAESVDIPLN